MVKNSSKKYDGVEELEEALILFGAMMIDKEWEQNLQKIARKKRN